MSKAVYVQEVAPPGGYPMVDYKRAFPKRGMPIGVAVGLGVGLYVFGHYRIALANQRRAHTQAERLQNNIDLALSLQAEEDLRYIEWVRENRQKEEAWREKNAPNLMSRKDLEAKTIAEGKNPNRLMQALQLGSEQYPDHQDLVYETRWMPRTRPIRPAGVKSYGY